MYWLLVLRPLIIFVSLLMITKNCRRSKIRRGLTIGLLPSNGNRSNLYITVLRYGLSSPLCSHLIILLIKFVAKRHNELSKEDTPTCNRLYPTLEMLMSDWEDLFKKEKFEPVHDALRAGIALLEKYYRRADNMNAYFISHSTSSPLIVVIEFNIKIINIVTYSLGPSYKTCISWSCMGRQVYWDGKEMLKRTSKFIRYMCIFSTLNRVFQFLVYKTRYEAMQKDTMVVHDRNQQSEICEFLIPYGFYFDWPILLCLDLSAMDTWMAKLMKKKQKKDGTLTTSSSISNINSDDDSFEEIMCWFKTK